MTATVRDTVRADDLDAVAYAVGTAPMTGSAGWSEVSVRTGLTGTRGETWLVVSAVPG